MTNQHGIRYSKNLFFLRLCIKSNLKNIYFRSFFGKSVIFVAKKDKQKPILCRNLELFFLEDVKEFFYELDEKVVTKIIFNVKKAELSNDPRLFKKLTKEIWEFRTKYENNQIRLLAFWDKRNKSDTLVICSHGFIKKTDKVHSKEIDKADNISIDYFTNQ